MSKNKYQEREPARKESYPTLENMKEGIDFGLYIIYILTFLKLINFYKKNF